MPTFRHHDYGNLYIQFNIKFPQRDQLQNLHLLEQVLPPRQQQATIPNDAMTEDFELQEVDADAREQARAQGHGSGHLAEDEDEDGIPAGGERVQCASQ